MTALFLRANLKMEKKLRMYKILPIILVLVLSGCATMMGKTTQVIRFTSDFKDGDKKVLPMNGATCTIKNSDGEWMVMTPGEITIPRISEPLYVSCEIFEKYSSFILSDKHYCSGIYKIFPNRLDNGSTAGNILFFPIAIGVDAIAGNSLLYPNRIKIILVKNDAQSNICIKEIVYNKKINLTSTLSDINPFGGGGEQVNFSESKTQLTKIFFESSDYYMEALALLHEAHGKDLEAKQIRSGIEFQNNSKISESERIQNSIRVTTEASEYIKSIDIQKSSTFSEEGKILYAKSLKSAVKGITTTIKLVPVSKKMVENIQANPTSAFRQLGGLAKVIPSIPNYINNMVKTIQLVLTGAKANDIEGVNNLEASLGEL